MKLPFPPAEIFDRSQTDFEQTVLSVFRFQFENNPVYQLFAKSLGKTPESVSSISEIPFLPVEFFKTHRIYCGNETPDVVFTSSGTTGAVTSRHEVRDKDLYTESFVRGFTHAYGPPDEFIFLFLLPSYLEREGSSLVFMAEELKKISNDPHSNFYLHNYAELAAALKKLRSAHAGKKIILLGVTYALLDLSDQFPQDISNVIVMETGGLKGKRKEITRDELHLTLKNAFHVSSVHSEYGMTELLSQAYSKGDGIFNCPPWMKILVRETNDPLSWAPQGKTGGVNIIDLANVHSCSFISTSDLGKLHDDGAFEILGRFDFSETRGCNLMVE